MGVAETDINGLSVREWGNPDGPEVVFVHGVVQSQKAFARQQADMLSQFRMVSYDLAGHGDSIKPSNPDRYSAPSHASDLRDILDAKGIVRPVLVGWSLGARLIAKYVRLYGTSRIAGVVLTGARAVHSDDASTRGPASGLIARMTSADPQEREASLHAFLRAQVHAPLSDADFALMRAYNMQCPLHVRTAILDWSRQYFPDYTAIDVPMLMIHGAEDSVALPTRIPAFAEQLGAELIVYPDVGHMPFWEDAPRFNGDLQRFVTSVAGTS